MKVLLLSHLALACLCVVALLSPNVASAQSNSGSPFSTPPSVSAVIAKYKSDACFSNFDKMDRPASTKLTAAICPDTECGKKFNDIISTYANSGDNYFALFGQVLGFHRDMACMKATNMTAPSGPAASNNSTTRVANPATCLEVVDNLMDNPPSPSIVYVLTVWSSTTTDYLRHAGNAVNDLRRRAPKAEVCDPSKCAYKYMHQWYKWLEAVPSEYLANMTTTQRGMLHPKDSPQDVAREFQDEVVAKCATEGGDAVGEESWWAGCRQVGGRGWRSQEGGGCCCEWSSLGP